MKSTPRRYELVVRHELTYDNHGNDYAVNRPSAGYVLRGCILTHSKHGERSEFENGYLLNDGDYIILKQVNEQSIFEQVSFTIAHDNSLPDALSEQIILNVLRALVEPMSVSDIAVACSVSLSTFKHHFFRMFNDTPHNWMMAARLKIADTLLTESNVQIWQVAAASGFCNKAHFSTRFKKYYGCSPQKRRQTSQK